MTRRIIAARCFWHIVDDRCCLLVCNALFPPPSSVAVGVGREYLADFIIAEHNERREREILVDPAELYLERIVLDDGSAEGFEIEACDVDDVDQQPPQRAIDAWQLAAERYELQKNASQFRLVSGK